MSYTYGTGANANYSGRVIVYPDQVPFDTDILRSNQYRMVDIALLAQTVLGLPTTFGGSYPSYSSGICTQNGTPDMTVNIGVCALYSLQQMEPIPYGNIPALTTPLIYKQSVNMIEFNSSTLGTITAPATPGESQYYLIQGISNTAQINSVNRPYYNSANPSSPTFASAADTEIDRITFSIVAGTAGVTPSIPSPTGGATGFFVILVANGQTTITNSDISAYSPSFIAETLQDKISEATADQRYVQIANNLPPTVDVLTAGSGTYNVPVGAIAIKVKGWAGGGGGGGSNSGAGLGGGGGGGGGAGYFEITIQNPAASYAYSVGTGGSAGSAGSNAGGAGNNTTFDGGTYTALGGNGGSAGIALAGGTSAAAVAGGNASGGDLNLKGSQGGCGFSIVEASLDEYPISGAGGSAPCGGVGGLSQSPAYNASSNGDAGSVPGGGGSGGASSGSGGNASGGAGADGLIIVEVTYS